MPSATQPAPATLDHRPESVVVISHSPLFYWWPVWAVGFLMAGLTYLHGYQVAFVPPGTVAEQGRQVEGFDGPRDVLVAPTGRPLPAAADGEELKQPRLRMAASNDLGIIWALVLCLVIVVTNVPLRGLWSFMVIMALIFASILLAVLGLWDPIVRAVRVVDVHITGFSYLSISLFLFAAWLVTVLLFDRMVYMVFTRGQLRVRMAVSQGESVYDTRGMMVERHRDDLFRHWLLGFGSGDLTVRTGGPNTRQLELPNVLGIGRKLALIHTMLQEREVVRAR
ncbi:MAG TPA: hypothetical protein VGF55_21275 [Gemmataceae bacterium]|jgi:hypothetical protein